MMIRDDNGGLCPCERCKGYVAASHTRSAAWEQYLILYRWLRGAGFRGDVAVYPYFDLYEPRLDPLLPVDLLIVGHGSGCSNYDPLWVTTTLHGSIVGRLVGLSRIRCFLAVGIAGALVCLGYAWFGVEIDSWAKAHAVSVPVRIASVVASLVCVWLLLKWAGHLTRRRPTAGGS